MGASYYEAVAAIDEAPFGRTSCGPMVLPVERRGRAQPALPVDAFRVVAGLLLTRYYVEHARYTPALIRLVGIPNRNDHSAFSFFSSIALQLGAEGCQACFALGTVLSAFVGLGIAARASAVAVLAISTVAYGAVRPFVTLDDCVAGATAFWLAVLPVGRTLHVLGIRRWRNWSNEFASGYAVAGCGVYFGLLLIQESLHNGQRPAARFSLSASTVWAAPLSCGVAIALCAVLLFTVVMRRASRPRAQQVPPFGIADAIGASAIVLLVIQVLSGAAGIEAVGSSSRAALAAAGMPVPVRTIEGRPVSDRLDIAFEREGTPTRGEGLDAKNPRLESVLHELELSSASQELRGMLVRRLMDVHCKQATATATSAEEEMILLKGGHVATHLGQIRCAEANGDPRSTAQF